MNNKPFKVDEPVWAKMRGHTPWPGKIMKPPEGEKLAKNSYCVFFFGTNNHASISQDKIYPYHKHKQEFSKKCKTKPFQKAVEDIAVFVENNYRRRRKVDCISSEKPMSQEEDEDDAENEQYVLLYRPDVTPKKRKQTLDDDVYTFRDVTPPKEAFISPRKKAKKESPENKSIILKESSVIIQPVANNVKKKVSHSSPKKLRKPNNDKKTFTLQSSIKITPIKSSIKVLTDTNSALKVQKSLPEIYLTTKKMKPASYQRSPIRIPFQHPRRLHLTFRAKPNTPELVNKIIGVIGLGKVGCTIADFLVKTHHKVVVWNRTESKYHMLSTYGHEIASCPAEVVLLCDIILCCVSTGDVAKQIVYGNCGILHGLFHVKELKARNRRGLVMLTTVDPNTSTTIADAVRRQGGRYLEAPIFNTSCKFKEKGVVFLSSGHPSLFREIAPVLREFGKSAVFYGPRIGKAAKMNLIASMYLGTVKEVLAEIAACLRMLHFDTNLFLRGAEASNFGDAVVDIFQHMTTGSFECPDRPLRYVQQDFKLGMQLADKLSVPMPVTQQAFMWFIRARACGFGCLDSCAVLRTRRT